jgi:predicted Zn-dependent protease
VPRTEPAARPAPDLVHRARTRFLAVGGLTGLVAAVVIIVAGNGHQSARLAPAAERVAVHPRYWVVRPGQSFASIAARESTTADQLERLNPRLLAGSLPPGARVLLPG